MKSKLIALVVAGALASGCQTYDPYTGEKKTSNATAGAVIGAVGGAVIGAATSSKKDRAKGALIGATAGGAIGGGIGYYMDKQEAELRHKLEGTGVRVVRNGNEITLVMPGNITFDTGRSDVKSAFYPTLESVGLVLKEFDKTIIEVAGHTDSTGGADLNQRLSEQRALSVGQFLVSQGVASTRVQTVGFGPRYPVATNKTADGRAANRRVELKLLPIEG
ncbi:OmpA family protein [Hahella ganghwensis]|uniref:OmpA family protein n=1 Tax=Hahella ganghwensis TaxID=286420 RepID=UPI0003807309|nr:OmpA family protein [Hahella ganghwensis]